MEALYGSTLSASYRAWQAGKGQKKVRKRSEKAGYPL